MKNSLKVPQGEIFVQAIDDTLVVYESKGGVLNPLMRLVAGAVTAIQREYYRTVIKSRIKQTEADLILKYFFETESEIDSLKLNDRIKYELIKRLGSLAPVDVSSLITANEREATTIIVNDVWDTDIPDLTPDYLDNIVTPYLNAVIELQHLIDTIKGRELSRINIKEIRRNSPISVSLEGAGEALQLIKDTIVPWRRKHAETMARLLEEEKSVEIEAKKAEVIGKRMVAREKADKLKLENEKLRLELQQAKIQLALEMLSSISSSLTQVERESMINKLLPILDTLGFGRLEIVSIE